MQQVFSRRAAAICRELCAAVDWNRPELKALAPGCPADDHDVQTAALRLVKHLRSRRRPDSGYGRDFAVRLRRAARPHHLQRAKATLTSALEAPLKPFTQHHKTLMMPPDEFQLAARTPA